MYILMKDDVPVTGIVFIDSNGVKHSVPAIKALWTDEELAAIGLQRVVVEEPEETIEQWRESAECRPMQGMLALGETEWSKIEDYYNKYATWSEKVIIDKAGNWKRNSQNIEFFAYLLDYSPEQVDQLFLDAQEIDA